MGIRGLGVIDEGDSGHRSHGADAVPRGYEGAKPVAYRSWSYPECARECRRCESVGDIVRRARMHICDGRQLLSAISPIIDKCPIYQEAVDQPEHPHPGSSSCNPDGTASLDHIRVLDHRTCYRIVRVVYGSYLGVLVHACFYTTVGIESTEVIDVIGSQIDAHRRERAHGGDVGQLGCAYLHRDYIEAVVHHHIDE